MNNDASTPATDTSELTAEVTATGTASSRPSYEITPELRPHADAIMATDLNDVPSPHSIPEGWGTSLTMRSTGLPPEMRREVEEKLAQLGDLPPELRAAKDVEFTAQAIRSKRMELRVMTGVGADATPYHREQVAIARDYRDLASDFDRLQKELERVARYETTVDPETGAPKALPIYAVTAERAQAYAMQQDDISRRMRLLVNDDGTMGHEGEKRLRQALHQSATQRAELQRQIEERAEAKQMALQINRDRRVKEQAERLASLQRNAS
jgi:hypothetical protein